MTENLRRHDGFYRYPSAPVGGAMCSTSVEIRSGSGSDGINSDRVYRWRLSHRLEIKVVAILLLALNRFDTASRDQSSNMADPAVASGGSLTAGAVREAFNAESLTVVSKQRAA